MPERQPIVCDAIRFTPSRRAWSWSLSLAIFCGAGGVIGLLLGLVSGALPSLALIVAFAFSLGLCQYLAAQSKLGPGSVEIDDEHLSLLGSARQAKVPLDDIVWGARRGRSVDFETRRGRRITLETSSEREGQRLLIQTGTDVDQRAVTLPLRATIGPAIAGLLYFLTLLFPVGMGASAWIPSASLLVTPLVSLALAWTIVRLFHRPRLSIGIDGVTIRRGMRRRFIRHEHIDEVSHRPGEEGAPARLALRAGGQRIELPTIGWTAEDHQRVVARIQAARERRRDRADATAFVRRGQPLGQWRAQLRRALAADGGFRTRRLGVEDADRVLSDPRAPLEQRVGAALALREVDEHLARRRIRFAADASVEEPTRNVLLATLEADDMDEEMLEEALSAIPHQTKLEPGGR